MGLPCIGSKGFRRSRVEAIRLGITQRIFINFLKPCHKKRGLYLYLRLKKMMDSRSVTGLIKCCILRFLMKWVLSLALLILAPCSAFSGATPVVVLDQKNLPKALGQFRHIQLT